MLDITRLNKIHVSVDVLLFYRKTRPILGCIVGHYPRAPKTERRRRAPACKRESALKPDPKSSNQLLSSLPPADFELIRPHLRFFDLPHQTTVVRAGEALTHIYFPLSGIISLVVRLTEGATVEIAMIGRDSVFGGSTALDGGISPIEAIVQLAGSATILDLSHLRKAASQSPTLRATLIRHEQALFSQSMQSAACNATHAIEARMSRWLLRARDLSGSEELILTQEFIAQMLGVQRTSVSVVANTLQRAGLIRYARGRIEITDVEGLIDSACECYGTVKARYDELRDGIRG